MTTFQVINCWRSGLAPGGSGGQPDEISGLSFWYDIQDTSTLFQDAAGTTPAGVGDPVGRVNDKSGNSYTLLSVADAGRPIHRQTGVGSGYHYLEFDGTNDSLIHTGTNVPCATVLATATLAASGFGSDPFGGIVTNRTDAANDVDFALLRDDTFDRFLVSQSAGGGLADATHFWVNQAQTNIYNDDTTQVFSCDGTNHPGSLRFPTGISVFSDRQLSGRHMTGRLFELFAYDSILSAADRISMENYLGARYGIVF